MPSKTGQGVRKDRDDQQQSGQGVRKDRDGQQQSGNKDQHSSPTPQRKQRQDNPGNFGNDSERASEAGRKGGRS